MEGRLHPDVSSAMETLAEFVAERTATLIAAKLEEGRGVKEVMNAKEAAEFLSIAPSTFRSMAPSLPRRQISERRYVYLRSELLEWLTAL